MTLDLRDVSVRIGATEIVHEVDLCVERGRWVTLIGPNGAGKSTLLRAVVGLHHASGHRELGGHPLATMTRRERARRIAYVPQEPVRPVGMRVRDFVLLGRTPHLPPLGRESATDLEIVEDAITTLGIGDLAARDVATLSGGEAQRTVIARALAQQPELLVMDEPTSALDLAAQLDVMEVIDRLRVDHAIGVLTSTHDLTLTARFAEVVHLIADGRIVRSGSPRDVLTAETIAAHYGAEVQVLTDPLGGIIVAPRRSPRRSP